MNDFSIEPYLNSREILKQTLDQLIKDFAGTLKMMSGLGYESVEMCSPPGYESSGFGLLMSMKG